MNANRRENPGRPRVAHARPIRVGVLRALVILTLAATGTATARADAVDRELLRQAPLILRQLRERGCRNVGVLKFRVQRGNGPASDQAGVMNLDLAARLEVALTLADDAREPIGIIHDASAVAATLPGATHLTPDGRRLLLEASYPLAWGNQRVRPDAMLTGVAAVSPDLRRLKVAVMAFDKDGGPLEGVATFDSAADAAALAKAGVHFLTVRPRGPSTRGRVAPSGRSSAPSIDGASPVTLEVYYDGLLVPVQHRDGGAWIPEPRPEQTIELVIRRAADDPQRYAALLMVNGLNTLFKEPFDPLACQKWVLGAGTTGVKVSGYQTGDSTAEQFRVLPTEESRRKEFQYGNSAGMIDLFVYAERTPTLEPAPSDLAEPALDPSRPDGVGSSPAAHPSDDDEEDLEAMTRGMPRARPANLSALKFRLREGGPPRGLVEGGERINNEMRRVPFHIDPQPIMHMTIRYYQPAPGR
jgi:hypothetical protein